MPAVPASVPQSAPPAWRPDRSLGVFETMLVLDGRPVELDAHLARLTASLEALFPRHSPPPLDVPSLKYPYGPASEGTSAPPGESALRIAIAPDEHNGLGVTVERRAAPRGDFLVHGSRKAPRAQISLHTLPVPGGLGAHKWTDRSLLDEAQADLAEDTIPLIVDADGSALEASRANVFVVRDGALLTPPADGRILPGVTRKRALGIAARLGIEIEETGVSRDDLLAADEVFLTGSVRGIERVRELDGAPLGDHTQVTERIATELHRAWAGAEFG
jgi:para-aminobenzoate synthetase/4-amino-4-deoxychorismate lyase